MPVLGMNIESVEAKRHAPVKGKLDITTTPTITDIKEMEIKGIDKKALDLKFEYVCSYNIDSKDKKGKEAAVIRLTGNVLFLAEDPVKILKEWKDKKVASEIAVPVLNTIFRKCGMKAMGLADDLQLPPPIRLPIVKSVKDSPRYIG